MDSKFLQLFAGLLAALFFAGAENQISAHFRETLRHLTAKAYGAAGDDSNTAVKIKNVANAHKGLPNKAHSSMVKFNSIGEAPSLWPGKSGRRFRAEGVHSC